MTYLIVGGSGFIGSQLAMFLIDAGQSVVVIDRIPSPVAGVRSIVTDIVQSLPVPDFAVDEVTIINLAGKNIFGRFTRAHRTELYESRITLTRKLYDWCVAHHMQISAYVGASAVGYYGDRPGAMLDEDSGPGTQFLARLCVDWESAHGLFRTLTDRVIILRQGHVLGRGGLLSVLVPLFRAGIGGTLGSGLQYMPWIGIEDLVRVYVRAAASLSVASSQSFSPLPAGTYNAVAGSPITNESFSDTLADRLGRACWLRIPVFALWLRFLSFAYEMTADQRVSGQKLAQHIPINDNLTTVLSDIQL